jgi:cobalt-zinc-cadmium efflux system outer membrane protein
MAGLIWPHSDSAAQASDRTTRTIRFDEIEALARTESPRARILGRQLTTIKAERDDALQWSNPALAYDHEDVESSREWQVTMHKRFVMPFSQTSQRDGWAARVRSAEYNHDQETQDLLAELKAGYVRLRLLDDYLDRLARLAELVELASAAAESRYAEGELSGAERQLIRLSALGVDADHRRVEQERREFAAVWGADMGIPAAVELRLSTSVTYEEVVLEKASEYVALLDGRPGIAAQRALAQALTKQADAARPSLIPGVDIYGGYKRIESEGGGFVAGIALDLPVFDRKAGAARLYEAKRQIVEDELAIFLARTTKEVESLVYLIEDAQQSLAAFAEHLDSEPPLTDTLLFSYQEGSLTLDAFLNAIQIESAALENYYEELSNYYRNIFRLEAITGVSIVQFGS